MATKPITVPDTLAALPAENLDAILAAAVGELLHHDADPEPDEYEAAADRFFAAIRAAAPEGD